MDTFDFILHIEFQHLRQKVVERVTKKDSSTFSSFVNAMTYFNVGGGKNVKVNVYGLGALSKMLTSKSVQTSVVQPEVVDQIQEMHQMIQKLNVELTTKGDKKKTLKEQMTQLM